MPTYDYQCRSCGTVTELIHSMLEEGPSTCDLCGGDLRRVLYPAGIIFKGSGFYRNDSRPTESSASSGSSSSKSDAGSAAGEPSSASGPTKDAKPSASASTSDTSPASQTEG